MKKVSLLLVALVMGFVLTSCENKKDTVIGLFNTFFDEEVAALNQVEDADAFLAYIDASDERFNNFYNMLDEKFPINEDEDFIGFSKEDSDAAMKVYSDRYDAYYAQREAKGSALYEPFIADLENLWDGDITDLLNSYESIEDIPDEVIAEADAKLQEKFDIAQKYVLLSNDEQFDRYLQFVASDEDEIVE